MSMCLHFLHSALKPCVYVSVLAGAGAIRVTSARASGRSPGAAPGTCRGKGTQPLVRQRHLLCVTPLCVSPISQGPWQGSSLHDTKMKPCSQGHWHHDQLFTRAATHRFLHSGCDCQVSARGQQLRACMHAWMQVWCVQASSAWLIGYCTTPHRRHGWGLWL